MERGDREYQNYISILQEELIPAMGCTEPIAVAYAAAKCREILGAIPDACQLNVSGNIIKNVKSVVVPNTNGLKGLRAAAAAGIVAGRPELELNVLSQVEDEALPLIREYMDTHTIEIHKADDVPVLYIDIRLFCGGHSARVVITDYHTNIVLIERDGQKILEKAREPEKGGIADAGMMSLEGIWEFIDIANVGDVKKLLDLQINCNSAISREGLENTWGAQIGRVLMAGGNSARVCACARAAAGSDARMSGCEMPVVIVGGSGNQGLAVSLPVLEYAERWGSEKDRVYRALMLSNLLAVYLKRDIGRLSAYCTAVTAGTAAGCAVAYLCGEELDVVKHVIVNSLAILSGMFCDGAKPSCAAKVAESVNAGLLGYEMVKNGQCFSGGDGILQHSVEETVETIGFLARESLREADRQILEIMIKT